MRKRPVGQRHLALSGRERIKVRIQRLLLTALIATGLGVTAAPQARAITDGEANYINDTTSVGMGPPVSVPMFLNEGYWVCDGVRGGNDVGYQAALVRDRDTGLSNYQSGQLVGFAIKNLCPDQLYKVRRQ
jgi:hypothetical protein